MEVKQDTVNAEGLRELVLARLAEGQMTAARTLGWIEGYAVGCNVAAVRLIQAQPGRFATMRVEILPVQLCPSPFSWNPTDPWNAVVGEVEVVEGNAAVPDEPAVAHEPDKAPADLDLGVTEEEVGRADS